ncbi:hypothetical protein DBV23_09350 [Edwardsiella ictaluri]|nr:hypothetical protein B6E78_09865 [Edwardsiella ictaluri]AVZ82434.1 hypothetical protein DBV23_09350 [Edwardsiella ictaluri]
MACIELLLIGYFYLRLLYVVTCLLTEIVIKKTKIQRNPFCGRSFHFDNPRRDQLLIDILV